MPQRQPQNAPQTPPQREEVGFEVREIMSLLTALQSRNPREDKAHVH